MTCILHLDDELLALLVLAVQVVDGFAVGFGSALLLGVQVREVLDLLAVAEYLVEKVNQQFLVELRAEQPLEAKIGERIDVTVLAHWAKIIIRKLILRHRNAPAAREFTIVPPGVYTHYVSTATCPGMSPIFPVSPCEMFTPCWQYCWQLSYCIVPALAR
jgi:hypothetical protein